MASTFWRWWKKKAIAPGILEIDHHNQNHVFWKSMTQGTWISIFQFRRASPSWRWWKKCGSCSMGRVMWEYNIDYPLQYFWQFSRVRQNIEKCVCEREREGIFLWQGTLSLGTTQTRDRSIRSTCDSQIFPSTSWGRRPLEMKYIYPSTLGHGVSEYIWL